MLHGQVGGNWNAKLVKFNSTGRNSKRPSVKYPPPQKREESYSQSFWSGLCFGDLHLKVKSELGEYGAVSSLQSSPVDGLLKL